MLNLVSIPKLYAFNSRGTPLDFGQVFTAFGVVLAGLCLSICLFTIERLTLNCGWCRRILNAYNYRIEVQQNTNLESAQAKEIIADINQVLLENQGDLFFLQKIRKSVQLRGQYSGYQLL